MEPQQSTPDFDWISFLRCQSTWPGDELDLSALEAGDTFSVYTLNSIYFMRLLDTRARKADLVTNTAGRPQGEVTINGCTWGLSSSIRPNHLFVGGNLEFSFVDESTGERLVHTTSDILELRFAPAGDGGRG